MATHRRHQKWVKNAVSEPVFSDTSLLNRWFWVNEVSWVSLLISSSTELLYSAIYSFELAVGRLFRHCLIFVISCLQKIIFQLFSDFLTLTWSGLISGLKPGKTSLLIPVASYKSKLGMQAKKWPLFCIFGWFLIFQLLGRFWPFWPVRHLWTKLGIPGLCQ